jgi:hypothetical protein
MNRWALIAGDIVANVVEQDDEPSIGGVWVDITGQHVGPGYTYDGTSFTPPPPPPPEPRIITKVSMLTRRLAQAEFVGILAAAKTDVAIEAWKYVFDAASTIDLDGQNSKDGMALLVSKKLLTQARATAILEAPVQPEERP